MRLIVRLIVRIVRHAASCASCGIVRHRDDCGRCVIVRPCDCGMCAIVRLIVRRATVGSHNIFSFFFGFVL